MNLKNEPGQSVLGCNGCMSLDERRAQMKAMQAHVATTHIILKFLNKKESKLICMREFEIILFQTQSLSI
jgi:hypothetical protein